MAVVKWTLYDPVLTETYAMEINPSEGGSPQRRKSVNTKATAAPDGKLLVFEGRDDPQELEWKGVILSQDHYEELNSWFDKRRQVMLTDDLGREFWVYITHFEARRQRAIHYPYKHEYTMRALILDWS